MVKIDFNKEIDELELFFEDVKENNINESDRKNILYGQEIVKTIKKLINKYNDKHENTSLKQIYSNLSSLTRGIEYFKDEEINKRYMQLGDQIYKMQQELEKIIKW